MRRKVCESCHVLHDMDALDVVSSKQHCFTCDMTRKVCQSCHVLHDMDTHTLDVGSSKQHCVPKHKSCGGGGPPPRRLK